MKLSQGRLEFGISLLTFHVHSQHVPFLIQILLHQRISLVLWNVHVLEDLVELLVDFLDRQPHDEDLDVLHIGVIVVIGREGSGPIGCVRIAVTALRRSRKKRVEEATRLCSVVF